jgi:general secretion pathway protein J
VATSSPSALCARRHRGARPARGFTLIELLIALAILAVIATLGYRAVAALTDTEVRLAAEAERWRALDGTLARLEADLRDAIPRDVRTGTGSEPAVFGAVDDAGNVALRIARAGPEFTADPGVAGQRLGYRLRDGVIEILYWPHLDQPAGVAPTVYALAAGVAAFRMGFLDSSGAWRDRWPVAGETPVPQAVRVELVLATGELIERWMVLR